MMLSAPRSEQELTSQFANESADFSGGGGEASVGKKFHAALLQTLPNDGRVAASLGVTFFVGKGG
jgi:hypothetical protein